MSKELSNLPYYQKLALEGEIASLLAVASHNAEVAFRTYIILNGVPKEYLDYTSECIRGMVELPEVDFERIKCEVKMGSIPVWLWADKVIADLKESIKVVDQINVGNADLNKKALKKKVVESAFVSFCREVILCYPEAAVKLCNKILADEPKLDFLYNACLVTLEVANKTAESIKELRKSYTKNAKKKLNKKKKDLLRLAFDVRNVLAFGTEIRMQAVADATEQAMKQIGDDIKTFPDAIARELDRGLRKAPKNIGNTSSTFIVQKVFKGSGEASNLREFKSRKEAVEFIKEIREQFPDLESTCTFIILESN